MYKLSLIAAALLVVSPLTLAGWSVDGDSSVNYVSIKNNAIAENNRFTGVSGGIDDAGKITVMIELASVETGVPIRNERMRDKFFAVAQWPKAVITAELDETALADLKGGATVQETVPVTVAMHGSKATLNATLRAISTTAGVHVTTVQPIILNADDFGFGPGVEMLQKLAGLQGISHAIPVTIDLKLTAN